MLEDRRREEEDAAAARPGWERRPPLRGSQQGGFRAAAALSRGAVGDRRVASVGVESDGADLHERLARLELLLGQIADGKSLTTPTTAELSNASGRVCFRCGQPGHYVGNCSVKDGRRCFNCNEVGHIARQCQKEKRQGNEKRTERAPQEHKVSVVTVETRQDETNGPIVACTAVNSLIARGKLGEFDAAYLIDTGARISLCPRAMADDDAMISANPRDIVRSVAGGEIPIVGYCERVVKMGGLETRHEFWVTSAALANPILGLHFMSPRGVKIDSGKGELRCEAGIIDLEMPTTPKTYFVALAQDVTLKEGHLTVVNAKIVNEGGKSIANVGERLLEAKTDFVARKNVAVARALVDGSSGRVPVQLMNLSGRRVKRRVKVRKGTRIGVLEAVNEYVAAIGTTSKEKGGKAEAEGEAGGGDEAGIDNSPAAKSEFLKRFKWDDCAVNDDEKRRIEEVLWEFRDVFSTGPCDLGKTDVVTHPIATGAAAPIKQAARRIPHAMRPVVEAQIQQMVESGVVRPSISPWASPVVLVRKRDGTYRFCVDYRQLNAVTEKDSFPLPRIDETLDALSGALFFTTLDLASGYWQVKMVASDVSKTAFVTSKGLYEFTVMPFGLTNAPATFQRLMERVLYGLTWEHCMVYLDDILIHSKTIEAHERSLREVLRRLRKANLKAKPSKCQFGRKRVDYLGHVVSPQGLSPQEEKVRAVRDFPRPQNVEGIRSFVNLAGYYRRFVANFSAIAKPLFHLLKKDVEFIWTPECQQALDALKQRLTEAPVLTFPKFDEMFYVATDACNHGLGAVLFHRIEGQEKVISYASRTLNDAERKYSTVEKEALGLLWAVVHFRVYLLGRPFVVVTDHCPLKWLKTVKDPTGRLARWLMTLSEYQWEVVHKSGKEHANADALSRQPVDSADGSTGEGDGTHRLEELLPPIEDEGSTPTLAAVGIQPRWSPSELAKLQEEDELIGRVRELLREDQTPNRRNWKATSQERRLLQVWDSLVLNDDVVFRRVELRTGADVEKKRVLVVPRAMIQQILNDAHDVGHLGEEKTLNRVRRQFWWPGYTNDTVEYVKACQECSQRRNPPGNRRAPMRSIPIGRPMEMIAMDFLGPLPETERKNKHLLIIADYYTKWIEAIPTQDQRAETTAQALLEQVSRHGVPVVVHSDKGPNFESRVIKALCGLLGMTKTRTTAYHPQCDGLVERANRTMLSVLSKYVADNQRDWDLKVPLALFGY